MSCYQLGFYCKILAKPKFSPNSYDLLVTWHPLLRESAVKCVDFSKIHLVIFVKNLCDFFFFVSSFLQFFPPFGEIDSSISVRICHIHRSLNVDNLLSFLTYGREEERKEGRVKGKEGRKERKGRKTEEERQERKGERKEGRKKGNEGRMKETCSLTRKHEENVGEEVQGT